MLLTLPLALLGLGLPIADAQGLELPQIFDASRLPTQFENFPLVEAAERPHPDLSDPEVVAKLEKEWLEATERTPTAALNRCPVSCNTAGSDTMNWDLYPNIARMAACNETVLFEMPVFAELDSDVAPAPLRVCTADAVAADKRATRRSVDADKTCAPALEIETVSSPRFVATGEQSRSQEAAGSAVSAVRQVSHRLEGISPSCNNNTIAFARAGNAVVGLYVGAQAHRQEIAAGLLDRLVARLETEDVSASIVLELCEPGAGHGADYVVGVAVNAAGDVREVQQSVRQWSQGSCLAVGASSQTLSDAAVTLLVPAPASALLANGPSSNNTVGSFSNQTSPNPALRARGLLARQEYCSNVKTVVEGNTCATIADKRCTISLNTFLSYNPGINCDKLQIGQKVCCTPGAVPPPDPLVPEPDPYCTNWKTVQADQTCAHIADKRCTVSLSTFKSRNPHLDCNNLRVGQTFCCNEGRVPPENECSNAKTVVEGNTCLHIADKRCTISIAKFIEYNPQLNCDSLKIGEPFCCNHGRVPPPGPAPNADGTCKTGTVAANDGCDTLASKCGIPGDYITLFNPKSGFCASLKPGQVFCCGRGNLPDLRPKKNADGSCFDYTVQPDDSCDAIAVRHQLTEADLFKFNQNTWGWKGCNSTDFWPGVKICLSEGTAPMPAPVSNAVCGPTVPGTQRPSNKSISLADLNPCPLNVCCNHWGQCGLNKDFCEVTPSKTGAPGTTMCISKCGNEIIRSAPPASQMRIAYFGAWNRNRPCLRMNVDFIDTSKYTHIHFAFAELTPTFEVVVSHVQDEWNRFIAMKGVKKIISFGGWDFSVFEPTYKILRDAVKPQNRETFRRNVVDFVNQHNLDGVDLDWEYPGAPDMPIIPAGDPSEGLDYSIWLKSVRDTLNSTKTVSFAAPASYWYLKAFPISTMATYIDYVVYMTYDLHGQWDVGNEWSMEGCKAGNCLRSHVNITQTLGALSMITKAGMPSNKVVVGVTSYGRSFRMAQANCVDPMCTFTGTNNVSNAAPGICTRTAGYISNAEINKIIAENPTADTWHTDLTDYLVYNDYEWVAYMSDETKALREVIYELYHMRGSSDWAVDLQSFEQDLYYGGDPAEFEVDPSNNRADCPDRIFKTLDELENAKVPSHCVDSYALETLAHMLEGTLAEYDNIMKTDYDKKFGYFAKAVKESWTAKLLEFYYDKDVNNDDWYNCYQVGNNNKLTCPPKGTTGSSVRMVVKDEKAFAEHLMSEFQISYEDTEAGEIPRNLAGCIPIYTGNPLNNGCALPHPEGSTVSGLRVIRKDLKIPNPKEEVGKSIENLRKLPAYLREVAEWARLDMLDIDTHPADILDTAAPGIFTVQESVDAMKKAYEIGEDVEEEEKKRKRENIIMWVLSAVLFILPGAGQALSAFTRIAMIGRIASITAYTGGAAMSAYEVANDPQFPVLACFFLLVDLIPGVGTFTKGTWRDGAIMRGKITQRDLEKMGPIIKDGLTKLDKIRNVCRR